MKRNFLTGIAMMVAAFFFGTEIAQAADISFSGKIRTRYENETKTNMVNNHSAHDFTATQVRLNAKANINSDTGAFVQMQSVRIWGNGNAAFTASDGDTSVGLHKAYFTIKNFAGIANLKMGRQEIVLDGHRLFGHTGWTTGAQTHDAVRLTHTHGNGTINYGYSMAQELTTTTADEDDIGTHFLHTNHQGVLGGSLSTYIVFMDDDCSVIAGIANCDANGGTNHWWTIGARQAGKMFGLDYRAEYYFQTGNGAGASAVISPGTTSEQPADGSPDGIANTLKGYGNEVNREAYMFGVRVGKTFANLPMKPKVTLWYDHLSGNSDDDMNDQDWGAFDTLYDTGHKFYGFMDLFLNNTGSATNYLGLRDLALKIVLKPAPKWTFKADIHNFHVAESPAGNPGMGIRTGIITQCVMADRNGGMSCAGGRDQGTELGSEVDLTLVHKYNPNVKLVLGYSQFMPEMLYHSVRGTGGGNANEARWAYLMADVKF